MALEDGITIHVHHSNGISNLLANTATTTFQNALDAVKTGTSVNGTFYKGGPAGTGQEIGLSLTEGGSPLTLPNTIYPTFSDGSEQTLYALYPEPSAETITGFYLDGTEYKFEGGGGTEYDAGEGISISQDNVISNTGVLSVNGRIGNVTIQTYTAGNGTDIKNGEIGLDGTYEGDSGGKDYSAMQGPAPSGFHVPLTTEWQGLKTIMDGLGLTSPNNWRINLHIPSAGRRYYSSADRINQGSESYYWSSSPHAHSSSNYADNLYMGSSSVVANNFSNRAYGFSVRCFKNSFEVPTSSWTVIQGTIGSAGIFWNQSDGIISITSDGSTGYTIMDKNLGATSVYNNGDTLSEANCGKYYQWGNNYGFAWTGSVTTSSTQVNAQNYGPGNYYSSSTFITGGMDWSSVHNDNLRGGRTGVQPIMISGNLAIGDKLYKIVTSTTAPASGTASNIITIVKDAGPSLLTYSELVALNNHTQIITELNTNPKGYYNSLNASGNIYPAASGGNYYLSDGIAQQRIDGYYYLYIISPQIWKEETGTPEPD